MFRNLRNRFDELREKAANKLAEFFGRGVQRGEDPSAAPLEQVIDADAVDAAIEQAFEQLKEIAQNTDIEEIQYSEAESDYSDYVLWGENAEEVRVFDPDTIDPQYLRVVRYATLSEAQNFLEEAGLLEFAEVLYVEDEDLFTIAVYDSPGVI